jgi:hypothetical protein
LYPRQVQALCSRGALWTTIPLPCSRKLTDTKTALAPWLRLPIVHVRTTFASAYILARPRLLPGCVWACLHSLRVCYRFVSACAPRPRLPSVRVRTTSTTALRLRLCLVCAMSETALRPLLSGVRTRGVSVVAPLPRPLRIRGRSASASAGRPRMSSFDKRFPKSYRSQRGRQLWCCSSGLYTAQHRPANVEASSSSKPACSQEFAGKKVARPFGQCCPLVDARRRTRRCSRALPAAKWAHTRQEARTPFPRRQATFKVMPRGRIESESPAAGSSAPARVQRMARFSLSARPRGRAHRGPRRKSLFPTNPISNLRRPRAFPCASSRRARRRTERAAKKGGDAFSSRCAPRASLAARKHMRPVAGRRHE